MYNPMNSAGAGVRPMGQSPMGMQRPAYRQVSVGSNGQSMDVRQNRRWNPMTGNGNPFSRARMDQEQQQAQQWQQWQQMMQQYQAMQPAPVPTGAPAATPPVPGAPPATPAAFAAPSSSPFSLAQALRNR